MQPIKQMQPEPQPWWASLLAALPVILPIINTILLSRQTAQSASNGQKIDELHKAVNGSTETDSTHK